MSDSWSVFQDGPNGVPAGRCREHAGAEARRDGACCQPRSTRRHLHGHINSPGFGRRTKSAPVHAPSRLADRLSPFHIRPGTHRRPPSASLPTFQALFDSLFKVLFIFPSRYLLLSVSRRYLGLGRNLPPDWGCIPKQPDSQTAPRGATGSGHDGALTLSGAPFQGTWARSAAEDASPDYNSDGEAPRYPLPRVDYGLMRGHDPCTHRKRGNTGRALLKFGFPWHMPFSGILATSPAANRPRRRDPNTSPDHSIGRSDGRCVQRAGT
ncbi:hypothetical protein L6452_46365 [Arctium lappa]|nr:hypothetical protein L6452_46365 [Arctium lappa]